MFSNISFENTDHAPQVNSDDYFVLIETPQFESPHQLLGWKVEAMHQPEETELPGEGPIKDLLKFFIKQTCSASTTDPLAAYALEMATQLLERDYTIIRIDNSNGSLSAYYPASIPSINGELKDQNIVFENPLSSQDLNRLSRRANRARCRQRFPVAVIMYNGKSVCRSATLSGCAEVYGRAALDMIRPGSLPSTSDADPDEMADVEVLVGDEGWKVLAEYQICDIALLKALKVGTIVDLMVENRKYKMGIPVTSSEKAVEDNKYRSNFILISLPFPGCEFFRNFHDQNYEPRDLRFDWAQPVCDAPLTMPEPEDHLNIDWNNYKEWDLLTMIQNYIKYILKYLEDNDAGILIHCISGWDRTPLFISLIRISLWADGLIHKSLETHEMLYLTLAYDWMLFGHHLADRLNKHEDVMLYCFAVLKYLADDEFSIRPNLRLRRTEAFSTFEAAERRYVAPPFSPESMDTSREHSKDSMDFHSASSVIPSPEAGFPLPMEEEGDGIRVLFDDRESSGAQGDVGRAAYEEDEALDDDDDAERVSVHDLYEEARMLEENVSSSSEEEADAPDDSTHGQGDGSRAAHEEGDNSRAQGDCQRVEYDEARALDDDAPPPDFDAAHDVKPPSPRMGLEPNPLGNWQLVSGTGSIRGSDTQSDVGTLSSQGSHGVASDSTNSRRMKLTQIRHLFYKCYYQTLSDKHVTYVRHRDMMSTILRNINELAAQLRGPPEQESSEQPQQQEEVQGEQEEVQGEQEELQPQPQGELQPQPQPQGEVQPQPQGEVQPQQGELQEEQQQPAPPEQEP